jgi:hypothetical protein
VKRIKKVGWDFVLAYEVVRAPGSENVGKPANVAVPLVLGGLLALVDEVTEEDDDVRVRMGHRGTERSLQVPGNRK